MCAWFKLLVLWYVVHYVIHYGNNWIKAAFSEVHSPSSNFSESRGNVMDNFTGSRSISRERHIENP